MRLLAFTLYALSEKGSDPLEGTLTRTVRRRVTRKVEMNSQADHGCEIVDFASLPGVLCPCGTARRAFADVADFPGTIHVTEIAADARLHYHRRLTETYYFLECGPDARMQLNEEIVPVHPGMCILIRPGTRHRAIGRMRVLIVVFPKFDPNDEWFDSSTP
jgi:mannose-6-phosphate isomerase-like protein (cupin superfamily)